MFGYTERDEMNKSSAMLILASMIIWLSGLIVPVAAQQDIDRTILPIAEPVYPSITELDARKAKAPPPFSVTAPKGAPNVVIVLIDDIGFGAANVFGGAIRTPHWINWRRKAYVLPNSTRPHCVHQPACQF